MNILVIKTGALGDVVRTSFIAQALKDKDKKSNPKIFWLTDKNALPLFSNNPYIERIFTKENINNLKKIKFDKIINLEEDEENCKLAVNLGADEILGFYYKNGTIVPSQTAKEWFDMSMLGKKPQNNTLKKQNKKTHRQIISEIIGVDWRRYEPFLRLNDKQKLFAKQFLRRYNLSRNDLIIGINTGAADRWPKSLSIKNTIKLIDSLSRKFKAKFILFGGKNEIERNREILRRSRSHIVDAGCGNDLFEFPALVSICNLMITSDSLGLHISLALKRKTLVLVGPTSSSELDMYGIGEKVISKSNCLCCYDKDCKSMAKIDLNEVVKKVDSLLSQEITLLITAYKEPKIGKAIESAINQKTDKSYNILVSAPDEETLSIARKYSSNHKNLKIFKDPGKGKSFALNMIFKNIKSDILILTDGDVHISENVIEEISHIFLDPAIGCLTGRPVPVENKKSKYGYWANFLFDAAHDIRKKSFEHDNFLECSGYLFAFRKDKIESIPLDVAEDTIIPYYFWEKGYLIGYAENAKVFVKNVDNFKDWVKQKIRTSKAHETLNKYVDIKTTPRVKTFKNETKGISYLFSYPQSFKEYLWTFELILARLYMWVRVFLETKFMRKNYGDAWERVESTK